MPITQIYIPLYVGFPRDPKVRALVVRHGIDGILAAYLYIVMALYCRENLTDGVVPVEEIGALAYPLPPDHAERLTKLLADERLIRELAGAQADAQANAQADAQADAQARAWLVLAYVKRNGTREQTEKRAAQLAEAGRVGGLRSRSDLGREADAKQGLEPGVKWSPSKVLSQTETETGKTSRARAHAPARGGTRQPPPSSEVVSRYKAPSDVAERGGAAAREALASRPRPEPRETAPAEGAGLHDEALARAQLAEIAAARQSSPLADEPPPPDEPSPPEQPPGDDYPF
jgi:hypothetical protein